jgi:hypothetical protein
MIKPRPSGSVWADARAKGLERLTFDQIGKRLVLTEAGHKLLG